MSVTQQQYPLFFIQRFKGKVLFNVPMSEHTSFKLGGAADVMAFPQDEGDLKDIITFAEAKNFPIYILGNGTNVLVKDGGIKGVVINMADGFKDISWENAKDGAAAVVGAGVKLSELVSECKDRGASGIEFACSIPGTVGGAVAMNAGAYGGEMKDVVEAVEIIGKKGHKSFLSKDEIGFSYRKSAIPKGAVITRAHMRFQIKDADEIKRKIKEFREKRNVSMGIPFANAGSVFKNPEGDFAGRLIEEAGLKGQTSGGAAVSDAHANVIVNRGNAKAKDVLALIALVRDRVYSMKGVVLELEINIIGED